MSLSSSSSNSVGDISTGEPGNISSGKVFTSESETASTKTSQSNGSVSKEEVLLYEKTILVSDTPTGESSSSEIDSSTQQQQEVIPDSTEGLSLIEPATSDALFGHSATSAVGTEAAGDLFAARRNEVNAVIQPMGPVTETFAKTADNEPDLINLSSSTYSSGPTGIDSSSEDIHLRLESQPNSSDERQNVSIKPKPGVTSAEFPSNEITAAAKEGPISGDRKTDNGKPGDELEKPAAVEPISDDDIEEPIVVKKIIPLEQQEAASARIEAADGEKRQDEEKEIEDDNIEEDSETPTIEQSKLKKGGTPGRGRGRGRRSRGRITRTGGRTRSPHDRDREEHGGEEAEPILDESEKQMADKDASDEHEGGEAKQDEAEGKMERATSPKKRRRTGVDAQLAQEAKAHGETPDQPGTESRRILRNRYQSPAGSGSGQEASRRGRRKQLSASSGEETHESDGERPVRQKRGAAQTRSPGTSPSPLHSTRPKRAKLTSVDEHQRSASSDNETKEDKRILRTRTTPASKHAIEPSTDHAKRSAARGRRSRGGGAAASQKKSGDPFDFDESAEPQSSPGPFRRVNVSKSNFGDVKYTKVFEKTSDKNKYTLTSKAAELKRQNTGGSSDTVIISDSPVELANTPPLYRVTTSKHVVIEKLSPRTNRVLKTLETDKPEGMRLTHTLSPELKRQISPVKSTPSSGNLADVSSIGSSESLGASNRQDSVGHKRYLDNPENIIDNDERQFGGVRRVQSRGRGNRSSSSSKSRGHSASLFSDVDIGDFDSPSGQARVAKRTIDDGRISWDDLPTRTPKRRRTADQLTPKPKEPELKHLSPEEQLSADFPSQNAHILAPGARVLARWVDKCFYAGWILTDEGLGRYKVKYYDGAVKVKPRPDLVAVSQLKLGDVLMVRKQTDEGDDNLEPVKITKVPSISDSDEWFDGVYEVENEVQETTERVSWEKFIIDVDQTRNYVTTTENKAAQDITAENITEKKERSARHRGAEQQQEDQEEEVRSEQRQRQTTPRERRTRTPRSAPRTSASPRRSGASSAASSSGGGDSPRRRRAGESFGRVSKVVSPASRRHQQPPQIFAGLKFVLTSANRRTKENDASEEERPSTITFNKKHVRQLIEDHGGLVVDDFSLVLDLSHCYLVADTHYRTHKYLSALARAVPCVKHTWIHESCAKKELLDEKPFMLAAGYSLENDTILPWHDKCPELLSGKSVLVYTENRPNNPTSLDFVQIWAPLVKCMGANVIETAPNAGTDHVDILLTDATCAASQLQAAESRGGKAVSSEWLIQAIITGRQPRPDGHKKYEYDYVEAPATASSGAAANPASGAGSTINENA